MSSYQTHQDDTNPSLKHEEISCPSHHSGQMPECTNDTQAIDEVPSDKTDDYFDVGAEFRDRVNAIKDGADTQYNPMSEKLPKLPVYHPSFLKAERYCIELMEGAALVLKNAEYKDTRILQLLEKSLNSTKLQYPRPRVVGLIGDSGVGKSSLINSLLDTPDIALSGASGEACTNVITEYRQARLSQKTPFVAEIVLYEPASVQRTLKSHFGWYYRHLHESLETMDQEAIDDLNAHVETASEIFQALFANREEFSDEERMKDFLEQAQSESDPEMLQTLFEWIQESISYFGAEDRIIRRSAYAPEELARETEPFVKSCKYLRDENDCQIPSFWPLVQRVRYFSLT